MKLFLIVLFSLNLFANNLIELDIKMLVNDNKELKQNNITLKKEITELKKNNQDLIKEKNSKKLEALRLHEGKILIEQAGDWTIHMPWIGAVFIGVFSTIVSILIVKTQSKVNKDVSLLQNTSIKEISTNEIKAKLLAGNRQNWINDLRNNISLYLSKITILYLEYGDDRRLDGVSQQKDIINKELEIEINNTIYKIELLINPNESKSNDLVKEVKDLYKNYKQIRQYDKFNEKIQFIVEISQSILKEEWERVKNNS